MLTIRSFGCYAAFGSKIPKGGDAMTLLSTPENSPRLTAHQAVRTSRSIATGVVTVTGTRRIEVIMASVGTQAVTPAALFHSAMALRRCRWVARAERRDCAQPRRPW
jgi:hypothetical protein